jgi:hypothetical protein
MRAGIIEAWVSGLTVEEIADATWRMIHIPVRRAQIIVHRTTSVDSAPPRTESMICANVKRLERALSSGSGIADCRAARCPEVD